MPLDGGEARIEIVRDALDRKHRDWLRPQVEIDGVALRFAVPILGEIDMSDLAKRVDAGIGPPRGADRNPLAGECGNGSGQHALDRDAIVLRLPTDIRGAVIFD